MIYSDISGGESLEIHARNLLKIETIFGAGGGGDAPPIPMFTNLHHYFV